MQYRFEEEKMTQIRNCARCQGDHELIFVELKGEPIETPEGNYTHYAMCPVTNQPVVQMRGVDPSAIDLPAPPGNEPSFSKELEHLINAHSVENGSNTPDFILAEYMMGCLRAYEQAVEKKEAWFKK